MATRYRQNEDGTLQIVAVDGAAEGKEAADGGARWRRGLRRAAYAAGLVTACVTLVIGWDANPLMALCAPALPCLRLFVSMFYDLHPGKRDGANDPDAHLAFYVAWLCLLAAAVVLVSNTEAVLTEAALWVFYLLSAFLFIFI